MLIFPKLYSLNPERKKRFKVEGYRFRVFLPEIFIIAVPINPKGPQVAPYCGNDSNDSNNRSYKNDSNNSDNSY